MPTPTAANEFSFSDGLTRPYGDVRAPSRNVEIPEIRANFIWNLGKHALQFGADIFVPNSIPVLVLSSSGE